MIYIYFISYIIAALVIILSEGLHSDKIKDYLILAGIFLTLINLELINKKLK